LGTAFWLIRLTNAAISASIESGQANVIPFEDSMQKQDRTVFFGSTPQASGGKPVQGGYVNLLGEAYYRIANYDSLEPFFISLVSGSDHWLFIASTGGLSAGRPPSTFISPTGACGTSTGMLWMKPTAGTSSSGMAGCIIYW
jgi:hypothetical protein